ncbi:outer membrane biogenesis protein BamB [Polystyrenella longa]|uniref:Outer membrane biogenesis protein BamB n=1 Tax=Polystyrenella longa TaxID=2528007 RepID=A0A518CSM0_9PLAN|nr:PQQ-binding-like beta-propeller repeat protein [Polystyrenella longa]QDU82231.1 outer membrane biogenesis protein BamB [Polystyrenella longa]
MSRPGSLALALIFPILFTASSQAEDWAQFRGHNASGVSTESTDLPVEFSIDDKVLWSAEVGEGIACPIIVNNLAYTTAMTDEEIFSVFCFDATTGAEIWRRDFETGELPPIMAPNKPASSTPVCDGERVYVYFSTLGMFALNADSGEDSWQLPIQMPYYLMGWGAAHSPIVHGDLVIFNQDDDLAPFLMAVDKNTGSPVWRTERPEMLGGYSVPVICETNGRTEVIVAGSGKLKGYDITDGKELWTCNSLLRTIMTTPVVKDEHVYVSVQSYGDTNRVLKYALLQWKDTNQDEKLEKSELEEAFWEKFDKGDKDKDGFLVDDEIDDAFQAAENRVGGGNIIQKIKVGGEGNVTDTHLIWNLDDSSPSNIASPLVIEDMIFLVKKGGIAASFEIEKGEPVWKRMRLRNFGNYYASPIAGDGKIYVQGENGYLVVIDQDSKKGKVLAKNFMGESCISTPAIANNRIYVRTLTKLYCFSNEAAK